MTIKRLFLYVLFLTATVNPIFAETDISGSLKIDLRSLTKKTYCDFYNREDILTLKISSDLSNNVSIYSSIQGRYWDKENVTTFSDMQDRGKVDPFTFDLWEAYIDISSFLSENLDARIGKQIIEWGTADMLNPTSTLNPHDLSDPLDFSKRIPISMLNLNYYLPWDSVNSLQVVWIPSHKSSLLPSGEMNMPMDMPIPDDLKNMESGGSSTNPMADKMDITMTQNQYVEHKPFYPKYSEVGLRLTGNILNTDFHISYFNGYDEFPMPEKVNISITNTDEINKKIADALTGVDKTNSFAVIAALNSIDKIPLNVDSSVYLSFPHYHVIGADFKTDLGGIGLWGEAGYYIPYKYDITYTYPDMDAMGSTDAIQNLISTETMDVKYKNAVYTLLDKPFLKYTLGVEYTFPGGWYVNTQFARGFFFERGESNLNDYLMLRMQKSFFSNLIQLSVFGGGSVGGGTLKYLLTDYDLPDNLSTGIFGGPRIDYYPYDGITLSLGAIFMGGKDSFFANMKDMQQVYFQAESSF